MDTKLWSFVHENGDVDEENPTPTNIHIGLRAGHLITRFHRLQDDPSHSRWRARTILMVSAQLAQ